MKYRKKPVVINAIQLRSDKEGIAEALRFCPSLMVYHDGFSVKTSEGRMSAKAGIGFSGVKGEFYFCKPDIFELTYEPVED